MKLNFFAILLTAILCFTIKCNASELIYPCNDNQLNSFISIALQNNPEVKALLNEAKAKEKVIRQKSTLNDPYLITGINNFPLSQFSFNASNMTYKLLALSQEIPYKGKLKLKGQIAKFEAASYTDRYNEKQREIIKKIKQNYFELAYHTQAIEITKKNRDLIKEFIKVSQIKYEVGKGTQQDILRAQIEFSKLEEEVINLEKEKDILKANLKNLACIL